MTNHNAKNERVKRQCFAFLADAQGHIEQTIEAAAKKSLGWDIEK
jgi:hypothetical protein